MFVCFDCYLLYFFTTWLLLHNKFNSTLANAQVSKLKSPMKLMTHKHWCHYFFLLFVNCIDENTKTSFFARENKKWMGDSLSRLKSNSCYLCHILTMSKLYLTTLSLSLTSLFPFSQCAHWERRERERERESLVEALVSNRRLARGFIAKHFSSN